MKTKLEEINQSVNDLYEDYPYPNHRVISKVVATLLRKTVSTMVESTGTPLRCLDAGCGTGEQSLGVAREYPTVEVTGIDYSKASVGVARDLAKQNEIAARFVRHNLMTPIKDLGVFDIITSVGVLHSLPDPAVGLRHLREVVRPHTVLLGMVYGTFGKWDMFQTRDALELICGDSSDRAEKLRVLKDSRMDSVSRATHYAQTLRKRLRFGPSIPIQEAVLRLAKGRNSAYLADSYAHVQEETYTWSELNALLSQNGWSLRGWPERSGMPDAPEQLLRGRALERARGISLLEQASIYERMVRPENLFFLATPS